MQIKMQKYAKIRKKRNKTRFICTCHFFFVTLRPIMKQKQQKRPRSRAGLWILVVAAGALEAISCVQYFTSRAAIREEAEQRAQTELKKAELEIELHTIEMETAAKTLALLVESHLNNPDSVFTDTRIAVSTLRRNTSMAVAYVPDYFPKQGRYFEACSSRISEDSIYTRQIGSADHDYTLMEWYQNGFVHDSCWWCEPYMDDSGSEAPVVSCSYPVRNQQGEVVAVVCVDMELGYLQKKLPEYLQVYKNSYYSIRSSKGGDIVRALDTVPGRKYNKFHEEIDATGWHIEIIIPEEEIFADLNRIGRLVGVLMLIGLALLGFIVWHTRRAVRNMLELAEKNQRMEGELEVAQTIQMAMLPKVFPPFLDRLDLNIYGLVNPAKEVGGDLYDFYVRHDKLFFCVGDVSGKGVPAALVMATARSLFRTITSREENAASIVSEMNDTLAEQNDQNMFLTLFLGVLDLQTGQLEYCNAGHNAPIHLPFGHMPVTIDVHANLPMGVMTGYPYQTQTVQMHYNDVLFLYTDGLTEAENGNHKQYGEERMLKKLGDCIACRPRELVETMQSDVETFVNGAPQSDDLTMLCIRYQKSAILMRNDIQQIPTLSEWIEGLGIPDALSMPINLALEEAVSNVMLYAYPDKQNEQVFVEFVRVKGEASVGSKSEKLIFTISDSGVPFDPTKQAEADVTLSAEEREIGGLGIHLVRQLMDEISYRREDNKNILTLVKNINY